MKERDELRPENREPATQASKEEFANNVDILTEKGYISASGERTKGYDMRGGRAVELFYYSAEAMQDRERFEDDPMKVHMNLLVPIDDHRSKMTAYYFRRSGAIEQYVSVRNFREMQEEGMRWLQAMQLSDTFPPEDPKLNRELVEGAESKLEGVRQVIKSMEEAKTLGLSFVSEADLSEINEILRKLIAAQKDKKK